MVVSRNHWEGKYGSPIVPQDPGGARCYLDRSRRFPPRLEPATGGGPLPLFLD